MPVSTPKYKNLFCQNSKKAGSYTGVFTVSRYQFVSAHFQEIQIGPEHQADVPEFLNPNSGKGY